MREQKFRYVLERRGEQKLFNISLIDCEIQSSTFERFRQLTVYEGWSIIDRGQYIGRRSINNVEIYEGDYLEGSESGKFGSILATWTDVVLWDKEKAGFVCMDIASGATLGLDEVDSDKIIENIYTHPERLRLIKREFDALRSGK